MVTNMDSLTVLLISGGFTILSTIFGVVGTLYTANRKSKVDGFDALARESANLRKEMRAELEMTRKEVSVLKQKVSLYEEEISVLRIKIERYEVEIASYQKDMRISESRIQTLKEQIDLLEKELHRYKSAV